MCGIAVTVEGDKIDVKPDPKDPFSKGSMCPKAPALGALHNDPDRLRYPVKKVGDSWQDISWPEAYALVEDGINNALKTHGPDSVGTYLGNPIVHNLGMLLFVKSLTGAIGSKNVFSATSMDQLPHHFAAHHMFGHEFRIPVPDIDRTDYMIMLGANPLASNGSIMTSAGVQERLRKISGRDGKLILIDPRRTETAKVASEHHFIKPGRDVYFLLSFLHVLHRDGIIHPGALTPHLKGLEHLPELVAGFSPAQTGNLTELAPDIVERLVAEFALQKRAVIYGRMGLSTQPHGGLCQWLLNLINIVSGNFDREGGMMFPSPAIELVRGKKGAQPLGRWASRVRGLPEFYGELPVSTMAEEIEIPGAGQIKAFMTICGNPVLSTPGGKRLDTLLPKMDFMVSIDNYINETTRHADVILPTPQGLEIDHYDLIFNIISVNNNVKFSPALFPAAKDRPYDWQVLKELTARIRGKATLYEKFATPRRAINLGLALGPYGWLSHPKRLLSGLSLKQVINSEHGVRLGPLRPRIPEGLHTLDGKIELAPDAFLQGVAALPHDDAPAAFCLIGRRNVSTNNSWMHQFEKLSKSRQVRCTVMINPADAHREGIENEDIVRVTGRTDKIDLPAEVTDAMMPGVLSIPHGFGHTRPGTRIRHAEAKPGVSVNDITDHLRVDKVTGNAAFSGQPVSIQRIKGARIERLQEGKPLTILYASQTGNAEMLARDIARAAEAHGMVAKLCDMADTDLEALARTQRLLVICSTYGTGDMPDAAQNLWQEAQTAPTGALADVPYAVFALGDISYEDFAKAGADWDKRLTTLGAVRVGPLVRADADYENTAQEWSETILSAISAGGDQDKTIKAEAAVKTRTNTYNRRNPALGTMLSKTKLTSKGSSKEVIHYEIALDGSDLTYTAGDTLNILPKNDPALVNALLKVMGCEGSERIGDYQESLWDLLTHQLEIRTPSNALLDYLRLCDGDPALWGADLLELIETHRALFPDMQHLTALMRPLSARSYSISSSPKTNAKKVHLTVASVKYERQGRRHKGTGSSYLANRVAEGETVRLYVTPNRFFSLPDDPARPIIMVGPGTGIAPFRGFLQERSLIKRSGQAWLFFGDRERAHDFLYQQELERFVKSGTLSRLDLAFSRDDLTRKTYVQDKMRGNGAQLWAWLEKGAYFYVCGDGKAMAPDVERALLDVIEDHGKQSDPQAYLQQMIREKRYLLDVY